MDFVFSSDSSSNYVDNDCIYTNTSESTTASSETKLYDKPCKIAQSFKIPWMPEWMLSKVRESDETQAIGYLDAK